MTIIIMWSDAIYDVFDYVEFLLVSTTALEEMLLSIKLVAMLKGP